MRNTRFTPILYLGFLFLIFAKPAEAVYLDPGTGSYVFQFLIAGLVGALFVVKSFWRNISFFLSRTFKKVTSSTAKTKKNKSNGSQT